MAAYALTLRNEKRRLYEGMALLVILINVVLFCVIALSTEKRQDRYLAIAALLLIVVCLAADQFPWKHKDKKKGPPFKFVAEMVISLSWWLTGYGWAGIITLVLGLLYLVAKRPLVLTISGESVRYPSFPPREITWDSLNTLLLKDGMVTIDFRDNRLIQQLVETDFTSVQEQEINDFCRQQLNA